MDRTLKILVGAAAIVVIAGGVYFVWGEYRRGRDVADELALAGCVRDFEMLAKADFTKTPRDVLIADVRLCARKGLVDKTEAERLGVDDI